MNGEWGMAENKESAAGGGEGVESAEETPCGQPPTSPLAWRTTIEDAANTLQCL